MKEARLACPICRAENAHEAAICFLCGQSLVGAEVAAAKKPGEAVSPEAHRPTFHLNSMMLVIAAIAIFLGVWHEAPVLAFYLAIPAVIALIRTVAVSGEGDSWFNHVAVYMVTFVSVIGVAILGFVAFFATCSAIVSTGFGPQGGYYLAPGLFIGGIVGLAVIIWLTVVIVRMDHRRRNR